MIRSLWKKHLTAQYNKYKNINTLKISRFLDWDKTINAFQQEYKNQLQSHLEQMEQIKLGTDTSTKTKLIKFKKKINKKFANLNKLQNKNDEKIDAGFEIIMTSVTELQEQTALEFRFLMFFVSLVIVHNCVGKIRTKFNHNKNRIVHGKRKRFKEKYKEYASTLTTLYTNIFDVDTWKLFLQFWSSRTGLYLIRNVLIQICVFNPHLNYKKMRFRVIVRELQNEGIFQYYLQVLEHICFDANIQSHMDLNHCRNRAQTIFKLLSDTGNKTDGETKTNTMIETIHSNKSIFKIGILLNTNKVHYFCILHYNDKYWIMQSWLSMYTFTDLVYRFACKEDNCVNLEQNVSDIETILNGLSDTTDEMKRNFQKAFWNMTGCYRSVEELTNAQVIEFDFAPVKPIAPKNNKLRF